MLIVARRHLDQEVADQHAVLRVHEADERRLASRKLGGTDNLLGEPRGRSEHPAHEIVVRFGRLSCDQVRTSEMGLKRERQSKDQPEPCTLRPPRAPLSHLPTLHPETAGTAGRAPPLDWRPAAHEVFINSRTRRKMFVCRSYTHGSSLSVSGLAWEEVSKVGVGVLSMAGGRCPTVRRNPVTLLTLQLHASVVRLPLACP